MSCTYMAAPETGTMAMAAAGRMPSMDAEPKTLTLDQIKLAREAAMYVVTSNTREEAVRIFTDGLKPVRAVGQQQHHHHHRATADSSSSSSDDDEIDGDSTPCGPGRPRRRSSHGPPPRSVERDVATAPF